MEKKKYIRFGEIPKCGKSVNFINLSFDESAGFNYEVEQGNIDEAYSLIPPDTLEGGISVFDCNSDGLILSNLRLVKSLLARLDSAIYLAEWVLSPLKVRYCWMGWTFSNPVKDFAD